MKTWIALLRGINVGGRNILPMADLRALAGELGCRDARTYIQSGNLVFEQESKSARQVAGLLQRKIERRFGFRPDILLLKADDLPRALAANPFSNVADSKSVHFFFLERAPKREIDRAAMERLRGASEDWQLSGSVFYLYAPDGIARSKLAASVEKILDVAATSRNLRTVEKLVELASHG